MLSLWYWKTFCMINFNFSTLKFCGNVKWETKITTNVHSNITQALTTTRVRSVPTLRTRVTVVHARFPPSTFVFVGSQRSVALMNTRCINCNYSELIYLSLYWTINNTKRFERCTASVTNTNAQHKVTDKRYGLSV